MAGHSKWANIKRKKEANDSVRSNVFTKMSRLITSAVSEGGGIGDPDKNFKLRLVIDRAKAANMPKETIQRAIDRAVGGDGSNMKEVVYEGFGPGNAALIITAITDNPNRTITDVKLALDRNGGKIASPNAVSYMFQKCGVLEVSKASVTEERAFEMFDALDGIEFEDGDESYIIYIPFENIGKVKDVLADTPVLSLDAFYLPNSPIALNEDLSTKVEHLVEKLEDLDDVQNVYSNIV